MGVETTWERVVEPMPDFKIIDVDSWNRKKTFQYFMDFELPYFNIIANVDVTELKAHCKENDLSFFLSSLFCSSKTIQRIEEFRYRWQNDQLICYDTVEAGSTVLLEDNTFGFCYFPPTDSLAEFNRIGEQLLKEIREKNHFEPKDGADDVIHYSVLPWIEFTSVQHARRTTRADTIPKIVFGKHFEKDGRFVMPVSVEVNHAMMDGYHVARYFEIFQQELCEING